MDIVNSEIFNLHQDAGKYLRKVSNKKIASVAVAVLAMLILFWIFLPIYQPFYKRIPPTTYAGGMILLLILVIFSLYFVGEAPIQRLKIDQDVAELARWMGEKHGDLYRQSAELTRVRARNSLIRLMRWVLTYQASRHTMEIVDADRNVTEYLRECLNIKIKKLNQDSSDHFDGLLKFGFVHKNEYGLLFKEAANQLDRA